jgi:hypothetical protein
VSELSRIENRLSACAESLADAAVDLLREAMRADDEDTRAELMAREKRVTRARRSVEKAIGLLQGASGEE